MFQLKHKNRTSRYITSQIVILFYFGVCFSSYAQGYDDSFELKSKLKFEIQYADYGEYEYPEPIIFNYGLTNYKQNYPFIVNFPEKRGLLKYTRLLGEGSALSTKYQYSQIRSDVDQHLGELKLISMLGEKWIGVVSTQMFNDSRDYYAFQSGVGFKWDAHPLTSIQVDLQYYYRNSAPIDVGGKLGSINSRIKVRQVLTLSTAFTLEYSYYFADGDFVNFNSHSLAGWLSQYLFTETAVHLNFKWYTNSLGIKSFSPSVEIAQYLDWRTVLHLKYRYYFNESKNVNLGEKGVIVPDNLKSHAASIQINREMSTDLLLYMKYRFYSSNLNVQMNTYLIGTVYSF